LALAEVVILRIFAGTEFEVEIAEVFVDNIASLAEIVEAGFFCLRSRTPLRPEDVGNAEDEEQNRGKVEGRIHILICTA